MALPKEYEMLFRLRGVLGNDFKQSFSQAAQYTQKLNKEQAQLQKTIGDIKEWQRAGETLKKNQKVYDELNGKLARNEELTKEQKKQLDEAEKSIRKAKEALEKYRDRMEKAGVSTEEAEKRLEELNRQYDKLARKQQSLDDLTASWQKHSAAMQTSLTHLRNWTVLYSAAMAGGYKLFVTPAAETEKSMSNVQAYFNASEAQVREMKANARQLGLTTPYTTTESAAAYESTAKAGWSVEDSMAAMPGIINLALASDEELAAVAETVTNYTKAFGIAPSDATHFADILAAAAMGSNADISDLTESLGYTAPIASALGFSAEDVLLMLGLQANMGLKGSRAGTALRRIMTEAGSGMRFQLDNREVEIATTDASGNMLSLREIIQNARSAFSGLSESEMAALTDTSELLSMAEAYGIDTNGMTLDEISEAVLSGASALSDAEAVAAAEAIAMKTAMGGLLTLINTSEEDFQKLASSIDNATGSAERMADTKMDNLYGDIEKLKSTLEETQITIGDALLPDMRELVQWTTDVAGGFAEWAAENEDVIRTVAEYIAKSGPMIAGLLGTKAAIHGVISLGSKLGLFFKTLTPGGWVGLAAVGIGALTAAFIEFEKQASRAALDEKFGDVSLSISQVKRAADDLVNSGKLGEIAAAFDSYESVENYRDAMLSAADAIKKKNWMVSVGIDLTPAEMNEYRSEVEDFVAKTKEYILESSAALNMGLSTILGTDNGFRNLAGAEILNEADAIGRELADHLTAAFEDGVFDETEQNIAAKLQAQLQGVTEKLNAYQKQGQLAALEAAYGGKLDRESALALFGEVSDLLGVSASEAKELYASTYASLLAARDNSTGEARAEAEAALAALEASGYQGMIGAASSGVLGTLTGILAETMDVSSLVGSGSQIRALMKGGLSQEEYSYAKKAMGDAKQDYFLNTTSAEREFLNQWYETYQSVAPYMSAYAAELSASGDSAGAQRIWEMESLYTSIYAAKHAGSTAQYGSAALMEDVLSGAGIFGELAGIAGDVQVNEGDVSLHNEFHISASDPQGTADEVERIVDEQLSKTFGRRYADEKKNERRAYIYDGE